MYQSTSIETSHQHFTVPCFKQNMLNQILSFRSMILINWSNALYNEMMKTITFLRVILSYHNIDSYGVNEYAPMFPQTYCQTLLYRKTLFCKLVQHIDFLFLIIWLNRLGAKWKNNNNLIKDLIKNYYDDRHAKLMWHSPWDLQYVMPAVLL